MTPAQLLLIAYLGYLKRHDQRMSYAILASCNNVLVVTILLLRMRVCFLT